MNRRDLLKAAGAAPVAATIPEAIPEVVTIGLEEASQGAYLAFEASDGISTRIWVLRPEGLADPEIYSVYRKVGLDAIKACRNLGR